MKSQAHIRSAWFFTKVAQRWPPPLLSRTPRMYFWMVRLLTLIPSLSSSPRMRSAPHSRPRAAMSRIRLMVSGGSGDVFRGRDRRRQNWRKPARCQRRTVSGWTRTIARRHDSNHLAPRSSFSRSTKWSFGRLLRRRRTLTWWRSTAFSSTSSRRGGPCPRRRLRSRSPAFAAPTATTTAPWEPEPRSGFERHSARASATWSTSTVAGRAPCAHQLPPGSRKDTHGSQHGDLMPVRHPRPSGARGTATESDSVALPPPVTHRLPAHPHGMEYVCHALDLRHGRKPQEIS